MTAKTLYYISKESHSHVVAALRFGGRAHAHTQLLREV